MDGFRAQFSRQWRGGEGGGGVWAWRWSLGITMRPALISRPSLGFAPLAASMIAHLKKNCDGAIFGRVTDPWPFGVRLEFNLRRKRVFFTESVPGNRFVRNRS